MFTAATYPRLAFFASASALASGVAVYATPYMGAATFAYALMVAGLYFRRGERRLHRALMATAMALDFALVLLLEFQRDAIGTVASLELAPLPLAHVVCSTLAVLPYVPMIFFGQRLMGAESAPTRRWHRRIGYTAFLLRTLGFLLMFSLLGRAGP